MSYNERRAWRRQQSPESQAAGYAAWRRKIPWSDEEIAARLDDAADRIARGTAPDDFLIDRTRRAATSVRNGRLSASVVRFILPELIRLCSICGKRAIYRNGFRGYCRLHRPVRQTHVSELRRCVDIVKYHQEKDRIDLATIHLRNRCSPLSARIGHQ